MEDYNEDDLKEEIEALSDLLKLKNRDLCARYPWLIRYEYYENYGVIWLDYLDPGLQINFGLDMAEEIKQTLIKNGTEDSFVIKNVRRRVNLTETGLYQSFDFEYAGGSPEVEQVIEKYKKKAQGICWLCGRPANKYDKNSPLGLYCDDCLGDFEYNEM